MPKLSFVFSVPLGPHFTPRLELTLSSLRQQKEMANIDIKVALCDVSNSDACKALADEYSDIVVYRRHGPDSGQSDAINEGWQAIPDGDVYSWLNADDYLSPTALKKVIDTFEADPEADLVFGQSLIIDEEDALIGLHPAVQEMSEDVTRSNPVSQPSCFYKKAALDEVGHLNVDQHYVMDWDLWLRFYRADKKFVYIPDILSCVLWEKGTKTSSWNNRRMAEIRQLVASSGKPIMTLKSMIGFTLHHFSEYSVFGPIVKRLIGLSVQNKAEPIRYWKSSGDKRIGAHIPLPFRLGGSFKEVVLDFDAPVSGVVELANCQQKIVEEDRVILSLEDRFESKEAKTNWPQLTLSEGSFSKLRRIAFSTA